MARRPGDIDRPHEDDRDDDDEVVPAAGPAEEKPVEKVEPLATQAVEDVGSNDPGDKLEEKEAVEAAPAESVRPTDLVEPVRHSSNAPVPAEPLVIDGLAAPLDVDEPADEPEAGGALKALLKRGAKAVKGLVSGSAGTDPDKPFVTATGGTSLTAQSTATTENKANRSIKDIRKDFEEAIEAHQADHPGDKLEYKLSDLAGNSFTVSRDDKEFATVRKNANNISYEFSGTLDFNMADIILRASKDTVLMLHSSKLEDIEAILKAVDTEPNKGKTIEFDAVTKGFLAKNGGLIDPALYPSIAARLQKENAPKAAADAAQAATQAAKPPNAPDPTAAEPVRHRPGSH